jgi:archaellum component FlaF (FlaF/FlaG flagellin family)
MYEIMYFIIGIIILISAIILYVALLESWDRTSETNRLLKMLVYSKDTTRSVTDENNKTQRFVDVVEKACK